jgi:hypothetical protein
MQNEIAKTASDPTVWKVVEILIFVVLAIAGFLLASAYNRSAAAIDKLSEAVGRFERFLTQQEEKNGVNEKEHAGMKGDIEKYHQRLNEAEDLLQKVKFVEQACPSNTNKEILA